MNIKYYQKFIDFFERHELYDKRLFDYLRVDGFDEPSFAGLNTNIASTSTDNTNQDIIEERVKLWNKIKDTNTFKAWFTNSLVGTKYYLATEHNNTYQTDSAPVPYGVTGETALATFNTIATPNVLGQTSDINFIYTTNVTPNTFFYGPYASPNNVTTQYSKVEMVKLAQQVWVGDRYNRTPTYDVTVGDQNAQIKGFFT